MNRIFQTRHINKKPRDFSQGLVSGTNWIAANMSHQDTKYQPKPQDCKTLNKSDQAWLFQIFAYLDAFKFKGKFYDKRGLKWPSK